MNPPDDKAYDQYDAPWKTAMEDCFADLMALFFPMAHEQIDWTQPCVFLEQELNQIRRDTRMGKRFVDKLARVTLKPVEGQKREQGNKCWLYTHLEVQASRESLLGKRIFTYNYRIFDKFDHPVSSFVILVDEHADWRPTRYRYGSLGSETSITFPIAKLTDYQDREEELLAMDNAFALFTVAHLRTRATFGDSLKRAQAKRTLIELLTAKGWTEERIHKLLKILDDLMYLPPGLNEKLWQELTHPNQSEAVMNYLRSLEYKAMEKGKMEGLLEGKMEGLLEGELRGELKGEAKLLRKQLERRFGPLPPSITEKLTQAREQDLERWGEAVLTAPNLDAVFHNTMH